MTYKTRIIMTLLATALTGTASAAITEDEAKVLGSELTEWGAEKAGNADGTIPPYTGERPTPPENYDPNQPGRHPDPFNDEVLFSITAENMDQYADNLTEGQQALFKKYPNYRMDIYPSRRTSAHMPHVLENTVKNATSCETAAEGNRLENCYGGFPFPIPKTGKEAMWNHLMANAAPAWGGRLQTWIVTESGTPVLQTDVKSRYEAPYMLHESAGKVLPSEYVYYQLRVDTVGPARRSGEKLVMQDSLDPYNPGRRAWQYLPGQRRVKLSPDLAYDTPAPSVAGIATIDQQRLFLGAQDRYDMKLVGKQDVFIMYNTFDLTDYEACTVEELLTPSFLNPDCVRWELHRTWVVEAKLTEGARHILPTRKFYFDEDSWSAGIADSWDAAGKIYRVDSSAPYPFYSSPHGQTAESNITYDLQSGAYASTGVFNFKGGGYYMLPAESKPREFSPQALSGGGIR